MAVPIDVPVLVVAAARRPLTVAKMLSGRGVTCLLAGHTACPRPLPSRLGRPRSTVLEAHGLLDILHPYLDHNGASVTISP